MVIPNECPLCDRVFHRHYQLTQHIQSVHNLSMFPCNICRLYFNSRDEYGRHLSTTSHLLAVGQIRPAPTPIQLLALPPPPPPPPSSPLSPLIIDLQRPPSNPIYHCIFCDMHSKYRSVISSHIRSKHCGFGKCKRCRDHCSNRRARPQQLQSTLTKSIDPQRPSPYPLFHCIYCDMCSAFRSVMRAHINTKHGHVGTCKRCPDHCPKLPHLPQQTPLSQLDQPLPTILIDFITSYHPDSVPTLSIEDLENFLKQ